MESQTSKLKTILEDGAVHTVPELIKKVYGINKPSSARLAARIYDLRKRGYKILSDEVEGKENCVAEEITQ